jgi:hypothetical protein
MAGVAAVARVGVAGIEVDAGTVVAVKAAPGLVEATGLAGVAVASPQAASKKLENKARTINLEQKENGLVIKSPQAIYNLKVPVTKLPASLPYEGLSFYDYHHI